MTPSTTPAIVQPEWKAGQLPPLILLIGLITVVILLGHEFLLASLVPHWGVLEPLWVKLSVDSVLVSGAAYFTVRKQEALHRQVAAETTERLRAEAKSRFRARLLDTVGQAIITTSSEGIILYLNRFAETLYGWLAPQITGQNISLLTPESLREQAAHIARKVQAGESWSGEMLHQRQDGSIFPALLTQTPAYDVEGELIGMTMLSSDDSSREKVNSALRESEVRYRALSEASPDDIFIVGRGAILQYINSNAAKRFGRAPELLIGTSTADLFPPQDPGLPNQGLEETRLGIEKALESGEASHREVQLTFRDRNLWQSIWLIPLKDSAGHVTAVMGVARDVTERKLPEEALRRSHNELEIRVAERTAALAQTNAALQLQKTLLELQGEASIDGILMVTAAGQIVSYNHLLTRMWNLSPEIMASQAESTLIQSLVSQLREPQKFLNRTAYLNDHPAARANDELLLRDGRIIDSYSAPVKNEDGTSYGRIWFFRDVTERKQTEEKLRSSEERFRQMTECVTEVFWMTDVKMDCMIYISPAFETVWGRSCAELYAAPGLWMEAIYPEDRPAVLTAFTTRRIQGDYNEEYRIVLPSGEIRWIHDRAFPITNDAGVVYRVVGIADDITERHQARVAMQSAMEEAERANAAKSEFLSRMSHELRTPMNAILGFGQILEMRELGPLESESVQHILSAGEHLLTLINEVLDISRIEAGRMSFSREAVPVADVIVEALTLVRPLADVSHIRLVNLAPAQAGWCVAADRQRLKQVLLNILSNAVKYNHEGGEVTVSAVANAAANTLRLSVKDTGPGISTADLDKLFTPFERLGAAQMGVEGTGIGLALSKNLVDAMDGKIGVDSTVGVGSLFWVEFPLVQSPLAQLLEFEPPALSPLKAVKPASTILYIEDNLPNLTLIERILATDRTISLLSAADGAGGLDLARQRHPDLILLDLHLPDIPGEEVLRRLRADPQTQSIPVVVISADATPRQFDRLLLAGAKSYLTKPLDLQRFIQVVTGILNERGR